MYNTSNVRVEIINVCNNHNHQGSNSDNNDNENSNVRTCKRIDVRLQNVYFLFFLQTDIIEYHIYIIYIYIHSYTHIYIYCNRHLVVPGLPTP